MVLGIDHLRSKWGVKKVAVIDWDVHAGDGTYSLLKNDANSLFISLHQYNNGTFYP